MPVLVVSAQTGEGLDSLRRLLADRVAARTPPSPGSTRMSKRRRRLRAWFGDGRPAGVQRADRERLVAALEEAGGVPRVVRAVDARTAPRGACDRLAVHSLGAPLEARSPASPASPGPGPGVGAAARPDLAPAAVRGAARPGRDRGPRPRRWCCRRPAGAVADARPERGHGQRGTGSRPARARRRRRRLRVTRPRWWTAAGLMQRVLAAAVVVGVVWLLVLGILGWLRIDEDVLPLPELGGVPIPTWLFLGGVLAGIPLAFLARLANGIGARRRSRAAARAYGDRSRRSRRSS